MIIIISMNKMLANINFFFNKVQFQVNPIRNDEIEKIKGQKNDPSEPEFSCKTCNPGYEVGVTL